MLWHVVIDRSITQEAARLRRRRDSDGNLDFDFNDFNDFEAVRFQFNDSVDRKSIQWSRDEGQLRSLSIRYKERWNVEELGAEILPHFRPATASNTETAQ